MLQFSLNTNNPLTVTLKLDGDDGWQVDWVELTAGEKVFRCPEVGWLDNQAKRSYMGPSSRTVNCTQT